MLGHDVFYFSVLLESVCYIFLKNVCVCEGPWSLFFRNVIFWFGSRLVLASVSEMKSALSSLIIWESVCRTGIIYSLDVW